MNIVSIPSTPNTPKSKNYTRTNTFYSRFELFSSQLLLGNFLHFHLFLTTWNNLFFLRKNHFDMARTAHVRIDPSMGTVCPTSHVRSTVHLNVINHKGVHIKSLHICIRFCILQKLQQEFSRFDWPSSLRAAMGLGLCFTSNTTIESSEWNDLFLGNHILQVSVGFPDVHLLDSLSCFSGVLKVHSEIRTSCFA